MTTLMALLIFSVVYIRSVRVRHPVHAVVLYGIVALLVCRVLTLKEALGYINWKTLGCLGGLFVLVELLTGLGLFRWLAERIAQRFADKPRVLFIFLPL